MPPSAPLSPLPALYASTGRDSTLSGHTGRLVPTLAAGSASALRWRPGTGDASHSRRKRPGR